MLGHLDGDGTEDDAFAAIVRRTRSFARRQRMWFRRDPRVTWLGADAESGRAGTLAPGNVVPMNVRFSKLHATGNDFLVVHDAVTG